MSPADRTLAERAREMADEKCWNGGPVEVPVRSKETRDLLTALADENDTLRATGKISGPGWTNVELKVNVDLRAERDRYWNLAVQLAKALSCNPAAWTGHQARENALAAFTAEKESRDV